MSRAHLTSHRVISSLESQLDYFSNSVYNSANEAIEYTRIQYNEVQHMITRLETRLSEAKTELARAEDSYSACVYRRDNYDDDDDRRPSCNFEHQALDRAASKVNEIEDLLRQALPLFDMMRGQCDTLRDNAQSLGANLSCMASSAKSELSGIDSDVTSYNSVKAPITSTINVGSVGVGSAAAVAAASTSNIGSSAAASGGRTKSAEPKHLISIPDGLSSQYSVKNKMVSSDITTISNQKMARVLFSNDHNAVISFTTTNITATMVNDMETIMRHNNILSVNVWFDNQNIEMAKSMGYTLSDRDSNDSRGANLVKNLS